MHILIMSTQLIILSIFSKYNEQLYDPFQVRIALASLFFLK